MNSEPAGAVKTLADQLAAVRTCGSRPTTKPPCGRVVPSEQTAHAFCAPSDSAAVVASRARRQLRRALEVDFLPVSEEQAVARVAFIGLKLLGSGVAGMNVNNGYIA